MSAASAAGGPAERTSARDRLPAEIGRAIDARVRAAVPVVAPAVAVAVFRDGELLLDAAWGHADPETGTPATPELRFDLASLTKLLTATLVLRAVSAGRAGLDDPIAAAVPELLGAGPRGVDGGQDPFDLVIAPAPAARAGLRVDPALPTVRQALAHISGLAPWRALFLAAGPVPPEPPAPDPVGRAERRAAVLAAIGAAPFVDRPGAAIRYSDLGFILLGELVRRRLTERPDAELDALLDAHLAGPLGLASVGYRPLDAGVARTRIAPTSVDLRWRGRRAWGEVEDENAAGLGGVSGHAGAFGTAADVAAFAEAWRSGDPRLAIDPALRADAVRAVAAEPGEARGLGWQLRPADGSGILGPLGADAYGHTGFTGTALAVDPGRRLVVAILTNRVHAGRFTPGVDALQRDLHALLAG